MLNVAEMCAESAHIQIDSKEALYLLAEPSTPDEARQAAIERAEAGERITHSTAKNIVSEHKNGNDGFPEFKKPPPYLPDGIKHCRYCDNLYDGKTFPTGCPYCYKKMHNLTEPWVEGLPEMMQAKVSPEPEPEWTDSELERKEQVINGLTVVANKKIDKALVAWAQENNIYVPIDRGTVWGNPFIVGEDGDRETVIENYKIYLGLKPSLLKYIDNLYADLPGKTGKVLGCWCYPLSCHGDILKESDQLLDYLDPQEMT
jgi:hypothetical protein